MEFDERVMNELVEAMVAVVAACGGRLILHVALPSDSRTLEPVNEVDLCEAVGAAA
jgi:hypothetical protein